MNESPPPSPTGTEGKIPPEGSEARVRGRKRGRLKPARITWLLAQLPDYDLPRADDRSGLVAALGGNPEAARLNLEIGFGDGVFLAELACRQPGDFWIGVDLYLDGMAILVSRLQALALGNVRLVRGSAQTLLAERIPSGALDRVVINFPDPWPKVRHHQRRLLQTPLLDLLADKMRPGAELDLATDWADYAEWMMALLSGHGAFANRVEGFSPPPEGWVQTRFQKKGWQAGRPTWHLAFRRSAQEFHPPIP